ncbi:hypothetical protein ACE3NQ_03910 [Paenibacillus terreus]|uniref:Uncharacterized protein n=1 Tax=Paenibacillus terreus TaxID=1387834 RepID=A0ABV5B3J6_9BACL
MEKQPNPSFRRSLIELLRKSGMDPKRVILEFDSSEREVIEFRPDLPQGLQAVLKARGSLTEEQLKGIEESVKESRESWD